MQLANYRQLREAVSFLREQGVTMRLDVPSELYPGIDYAAHAFDPDGHCIQLYYYMEQAGEWPDALEPMSDTFQGKVFAGPWA